MVEPQTREDYVGNVPIFPLGTPFCNIHGSTHYPQMTKFMLTQAQQLNIKKNDNRKRNSWLPEYQHVK